ncbi:MAG: toll/interleukin-1 receptor domain-containing protein, partial [Erysipelotrichales bacterium]|nr:toll/interleukin-1 receptor domain-containing protein [Erysipelotrichales bacterium]
MEEKFSLIKPYEGSDNYIFISYAHKDSERVFPLLRKLTENGYRIWYDEGIDPGTEWPESIARHLESSSVCLSFISP